MIFLFSIYTSTCQEFIMKKLFILFCTITSISMYGGKFTIKNDMQNSVMILVCNKTKPNASSKLMGKNINPDEEFIFISEEKTIVSISYGSTTHENEAHCSVLLPEIPTENSPILVSGFFPPITPQ